MIETELTPQQEAYLEWKTHPVTQAFLSYLRQKREASKEAWANAQYVDSHDKADIYMNAGAIAACSIIQDILDLEADQILGDIDG